MPSALQTFRAGSAASRAVPLSGLIRLAEIAAALGGPRVMPGKAEILALNLRRVVNSSVDPLVPGLERARSGGSGALHREAELVRQGFASYGRYWAESFRLPFLSKSGIDRGFSYVGHGHIQRVRAAGFGPIIVLPHLGGWEWAAAWLAVTQGIGVTAVVERLEPPEVFEWFTDLREAYGVHVVPLGPGAMGELTAAVQRRDVVCLLADRDIGGTGLPQRFFGQPTSLPVGPAVLARRTGAPLVPTGVFFRGRQRATVVTEPIPVEGKGRAENQRLTEAAAARIERLIASAPSQWHVLEPNWPDDR